MTTIKLNQEKRTRKEIVIDLIWTGKKMSNASMLFRRTMADRLGLCDTDIGCIDRLLEVGSVTAGQLAEITGLTTGAVTSVINRLEGAGFVKREGDVKDRRKIIIKPVMGAFAKVASFHRSLEKETDKLLSGYTDKDLEFIIRHNNRMSALFEKEIAKMRSSKKK
jgi:DNA-binding MarR family transcriptional regulator